MSLLLFNQVLNHGKDIMLEPVVQAAATIKINNRLQPFLQVFLDQQGQRRLIRAHGVFWFYEK